MTRIMTPVDFHSTSDYQQDESVGHLIKRILLSMACRTDALLEPCGLTSAQGLPLMLLNASRGPTVAEIARSLQVDAGATTRLIDRLERKGLCKRVRSSADRRIMNVELTAEGQRVMSEVPAVLCRVMNEHLAGFSNNEWSALMHYLQRMAHNAEAMRKSDATLPCPDLRPGSEAPPTLRSHHRQRP